MEELGVLRCPPPLVSPVSPVLLPEEQLELGRWSVHRSQ